MDIKCHFLFSTIIISFLMTISGCDNDTRTIGGSGLIEADGIIVSAETAGRVESLRFEEGTSVCQGDTLLIIDPTRLELELAAARAGQKVALARLESARLQLEQSKESERFVNAERDRIATLVRSGTATQQQLDQLEHELTSATLARRTAQANATAIEAELTKIEADINRLKRQLQDCYPICPTSGTVTAKYVEAGELLAPGRPIAKISRLDTLWVKIYLPTADFAQVKISDKVIVDTESGNRQYQGEIVWTSEEAEFTPKNVQTKKARTNLVYAVKVRVVNTDGLLKIGMPVFVSVEK
ncbi:MAG: HlyD family secretion protein [Candidatus Zixiibacteriota bacterium]